MLGLSINKISHLFGVDSGSVYSWIRRGCPSTPAVGRGRPAQMHFGFVLTWRLKRLEREGFGNTDYIANYEKMARERFKALKKK
ncbi:hypothetical protein AYO43_01295 [Nitrospira sp. SCGC AG-212-E16]|nr:hypothetical protein AYO43_01295 [Nitrospira sp. SCGC AG-212-E16]